MIHCNGCTDNKVLLLVSKKRCVMTSNEIYIKKGVSKKNAVIKLRGFVIPKEINMRLYKGIFASEKDCQSIPYYN